MRTTTLKNFLVERINTNSEDPYAEKWCDKYYALLQKDIKVMKDKQLKIT